MEVLDIFCDESGSTGQNLLNPDQRFFAYGSVAIDPAEASDLVARTIRDFRIQGNELKGKNLLRHAGGRKAALALVRTLASRSQVLIAHKEYALACKLFEYTFEPLISDVSTVLYSVNFHKFIANLVYLSSANHHPRAREFSKRFEAAARGDVEAFRGFLSVHSPTTDDPVETLISFCVFHRDSILRDLSKTRSELPWVLDITATSLNSLLTTWGRRAPQLRVVCDESGPLASILPDFDIWVDNAEKHSIQLGEREIQLGFNLAIPIRLAKSHETPGIQLADVLSSVGVAVVSDPSDKWSKDVMRLLLESDALHPDGIVPERDRIDLNLPETRMNVLILLDLVRRSEAGESLIVGLPDFVNRAAGAI